MPLNTLKPLPAFIREGKIIIEQTAPTDIAIFNFARTIFRIKNAVAILIEKSKCKNGVNCHECVNECVCLWESNDNLSVGRFTNLQIKQLNNSPSPIKQLTIHD